MDNNVIDTSIGALGFSVWPPEDPPWAAYTKITFPKFGGVYFVPDDLDYSTQTLLIFDGVDGSGQYIQCGTYTQGLTNFAIVANPLMGDVFQVLDTANNILLSVNGAGYVKLNKISFAGTSPAIALGAGAGTGATVAINRGTDSAFQVAYKAASSGSGSGGVQFHVTFNTPFANVPIIVACPDGADALPNFSSGVVNSVTVNGFDWYALSAMVSSVNPQKINFICIG